MLLLMHFVVTEENQNLLFSLTLVGHLFKNLLHCIYNCCIVLLLTHEMTYYNNHFCYDLKIVL